MPDIIQFKNGNQICNLYDAGGRKLRTEYSTLGTPVIVPVGSIGSAGNPTNCSDYIYGTEYLDNFEYGFENDCGNYVMYLDKIYNSEGYAMGLYNNYPYWYSALNYNYYRKDHLGNIREVWQAPPSGGGGAGFTSQRTQYYPSGLPWAEGEGQEVQNKKYNGKEWIEAHGLDEYDSQARMYYPAIMRTTTIDPLAEKYYSISPYAWCGNNPVNRIDPDGMKIIFVVGNSQYEYYNGDFWQMKKDDNGNMIRTNIRYNPGKESVSKTMYRVLAAYRKIENSSDDILKGILHKLEKTETGHYVYENNSGENSVQGEYDKDNKLEYTQTTHDLNKSSGSDYKGIGDSDLGTVVHEMRHQYDREIDNMKDNVGSPFYNDQNNKLHLNPPEIRAVYLENRARKLENLQPRTTYTIKILQRLLNNPPNNKMPK